MKLSREELLERENEFLRLEITCLKKIGAFHNDPDAFLEKHSQHCIRTERKMV